MYTDVHDGLFPTADWTQFEPPNYPPNQHGDPWFHPSGYGYVPSNWSTVLLDTYDDDPLNLSLVCPGDTRTQGANLELRDRSATNNHDDAESIGMGVSYWLSYSLYLGPRALTRSRPTIDERYFVSQRLDMVRYPSLKGTIKERLPVHDSAQKQVDIGAATFPARFNVGATDGHVKFRSTDTFHPGLVFGDRGDPLTGGSRSLINAIDFTRNGIYGRDW